MATINLTQEEVFDAIRKDGFSVHTLELIDNYVNDILYGRTNISKFNLQEHAGLCSGTSVLIGAYIIATYAREVLESNSDSTTSQGPANWEIDAKQEELVQRWAEAKKLWMPDSEHVLTSTFGPKVAQGAEAKVYYKEGLRSVIKERSSIYSTLGKAFEAIVLHNTLFPETRMKVIGFTRDLEDLFRIVLTQPVVEYERLATKDEIDAMVAAKGFVDNHDGNRVNYVGERLLLEDMHPANVFIDQVTHQPICIDCIVKFK